MALFLGILGFHPSISVQFLPMSLGQRYSIEFPRRSEAVMIILDKLADLDCTGPVFDQNLRNLVGLPCLGKMVTASSQSNGAENSLTEK